MSPTKYRHKKEIMLSYVISKIKDNKWTRLWEIGCKEQMWKNNGKDIKGAGVLKPRKMWRNEVHLYVLGTQNYVIINELLYAKILFKIHPLHE
jgi:hypothetical protein